MLHVRHLLVHICNTLHVELIRKRHDENSKGAGPGGGGCFSVTNK